MYVLHTVSMYVFFRQTRGLLLWIYPLRVISFVLLVRNLAFGSLIHHGVTYLIIHATGECWWDTVLHAAKETQGTRHFTLMTFIIGNENKVGTLLCRMCGPVSTARSHKHTQICSADTTAHKHRHTRSSPRFLGWHSLERTFSFCSPDCL